MLWPKPAVTSSQNKIRVSCLQIRAVSWFILSDCYSIQLWKMVSPLLTAFRIQQVLFHVYRKLLVNTKCLQCMYELYNYSKQL